MMDYRTRVRSSTMTAFVLRAAAARARIVATDLRSGPGMRAYRFACHVEPAAIAAAELRPLAVLERCAVRGAAGHELDDAVIVVGAAAHGFEDLETEPLGLARPADDLGAIHLAAGRYVVGLDQVVDGTAKICGVPGSHERDGGVRLRTVEERPAAASERVSRSTGARSTHRGMVPRQTVTGSCRGPPPADRWNVCAVRDRERWMVERRVLHLDPAIRQPVGQEVDQR